MPNKGQRSLTPEEMLDYLQSHVYVDGDCRLWAGPFTGRVNGDYPRIYWQHKARLAHRLFLELSGRTIPKGYCVWTTCGNKACISLEHLRMGTRKQAMMVAAKRGAFPRGARRSLSIALGRAHQSKLGINRAAEVIQLRAQGWTLRRIGEKYGVLPSAVGHALKAWERAGVTAWTVQRAA